MNIKRFATLSLPRSRDLIMNLHMAGVRSEAEVFETRKTGRYGLSR
jgi:hypothetical protein